MSRGEGIMSSLARRACDARPDRGGLGRRVLMEFSRLFALQARPA